MEFETVLCLRPSSAPADVSFFFSRRARANLCPRPSPSLHTLSRGSVINLWWSRRGEDAYTPQFSSFLMRFLALPERFSPPQLNATVKENYPPFSPDFRNRRSHRQRLNDRKTFLNRSISIWKFEIGYFSCVNTCAFLRPYIARNGFSTITRKVNKYPGTVPLLFFFLLPSQHNPLQ